MKILFSTFIVLFAAGCAGDIRTSSTSSTRYQRYHPGHASPTYATRYGTVRSGDFADSRVAGTVVRESTGPDVDGWNQRYYGGRYHDNRYYVDQAYAYRPGGVPRTVYVVQNNVPIRRDVYVNPDGGFYEWNDGRRLSVEGPYFDTYNSAYDASIGRVGVGRNRLTVSR